MTQLVLTPAQVAAPQNTLAPSISGAAQVRQALTGNPGTWTGGPLLGVQWLRGGQVISGATGLTYVLQEADLGALVALRITASNAGGTQVATSAAVWPVTALPANSADTFDTATSVSVLSYVGESGQVWTQRGGDSVTPATVAGGVCVAVEHAAARVVSRGPVLDPDQFAQATFVRGGAANSSVALAVRVSDAGSAYWFRFNGALAEWQLFRSNATSATLMGSFAGSVAGWAGPEDTALVRLEAQGATLREIGRAHV